MIGFPTKRLVLLPSLGAMIWEAGIKNVGEAVLRNG